MAAWLGMVPLSMIVRKPHGQESPRRTLRRRSGAEALATAQTNSHRSGFDSDRPAAGTARASAGGGAGCSSGGVAHGAGVALARRGLRHPASALADLYLCRIIFFASGHQSGER